jgi:hypothetical protein
LSSVLRNIALIFNSFFSAISSKILKVIVIALFY